jgi:hypothetical protein
MSGTLGWMVGESAGEREEENVGAIASFDHESVLRGSSDSFQATSNDVDATDCEFGLVWP